GVVSRGAEGPWLEGLLEIHAGLVEALARGVLEVVPGALHGVLVAMRAPLVVAVGPVPLELRGQHVEVPALELRIRPGLPAVAKRVLVFHPRLVLAEAAFPVRPESIAIVLPHRSLGVLL